MGIPEQIIAYPFFSGERTDKVLTDYERQECIFTKNARFARKGQLSTRLGGEKYNLSALAGGGDCLGLHDFRYYGGQSFLECEADKIYVDNGTTRTQVKSGMASTDYYTFETFDGFAWITNGVDKLMKFDGVNITQGSIDAPTIHPSPPVAAGAKYYAYLVTFTSADGQESNPYILSTACVAQTINAVSGANPINLTSIPISTDAQVTGRNIYRTQENIDADSARLDLYNAQYVGSIADNTTTTFSDTVTDSNLGQLIFLDHDAAPILTKVVKHQNRLFGFYRDTLYFTKLFSGWYWPQATVDLSADASDFRIPVSPEDGNPITNIVAYYDYLLIFKSNQIYILSGYDETDFALKRLEVEEGVGCISKRGAVVQSNACYFISNNGIYRTNGQIVDYVGLPVEAFFDPDNPNVTTKVNTGYLQNSNAIVYNRKPNNQIRFSMPSLLNDKNDITLVFDHKLQSWCHDEGYIAQSWCIRTTNNKDYLMRGDDKGWVYTEDSIEGDGALIYSSSTGSNTINTLNDTTLSMTANAYKGLYIKLVDGTGDGYKQRILSNTATQFTIEGSWGAITYGQATGGGASTLENTTVAMTVNNYVGLDLVIYAGTGSGQTREIQSNTATEFTLTSAWSVIPDATSQYYVSDGTGSIPDTTTEYTVGGIEFDVQHMWENYGNPTLSKRLLYIRPRLDTSGNYSAKVFYYWDFQVDPSESETVALSSESMWDIALWDVGIFDDVYMTQELINVPSNHIHKWSSIRFFHDIPGQPIKLNGYDKIFQMKTSR